MGLKKKVQKQKFRSRKKEKNLTNNVNYAPDSDVFGFEETH